MNEKRNPAVNLGPPHAPANTPIHNEKAKEQNQKAKTTKTNIMRRVPTGGGGGLGRGV